MRLVWLFESTTGLHGHARHALRDAERLAARGHDVVVLSKDAADDDTAGGVTLRRVQAFDAASVPACDVVIATHWTTVDTARSCGRGTPAWWCAAYAPAGIADAALRARAEAACRQPIHRLAISASTADLLAAQLEAGDGHELLTLPGAIEPQHMFPSAPRPAAGVTRVGLVGAWDRPGGAVRHGLQACRLALQSGLALRLVRVAEGGPTADEQALGVPTAWHGRLADAERGELFRGLDVLLAAATPHGGDGFAQGTLEAMACGVPCVMTDVPAHRELATDRSDYALFVEPGNVHEMAEALVLTAAHPGLREQIRDSGLEVAAGYAPERHLDALEAALLHLAGSPTPDLPRTTAPRVTPESATAASLAVHGDADAECAELVERLLARGERLLHADRFEQALAAFEAASRLAPDDPAIGDRIGSAAFLAGDATRALRAFDALLATGGDDDRTLLEKRGLVLIGMDRWHEAARSFERASRCPGADAETFNSLGVALHELGDIAGARRAFDEALRREPDHADAGRNRRAVDEPARAGQHR